MDRALLLLELDRVEVVGGLLEGGDQRLEVADRLAVDAGDDQVAQALVADGGRGGDDPAEEHHPVAPLGVVVRVEHHVQQVERGGRLPVLAERLEQRAAELLEDQPALDQVGRGRAELVERHQFLPAVAPLEGGGDGDRGAGAPQVELDRGAVALAAADQVAPEQGAVVRVAEVAAAVDRGVVDRGDHVALGQAGLLGGAAGAHLVDVDAAAVVGEPEPGAERRVVGAGGGDPERGEADVVALGGGGEELAHDRGGDHLAELVLAVVAGEQAGEAPVAQDRQRVTAGGALHRGLELEGQEELLGQEGGGDVDAAQGAAGQQGGAVFLHLHDVEGRAERRVLGELQRLHAGGEAGVVLRVGQVQQGEVGLVVDRADRGGGGARAVDGLELDEGGVGDHLGGGQDPGGRNQGAQRGPPGGRVALPRLAGVPRLEGRADADHRAGGRRGGGDGGRLVGGKQRGGGGKGGAQVNGQVEVHDKIRGPGGRRF